MTTTPYSLKKRATVRALAGAAVSACLVATIGLVSSSAAEPAAPPAAGAPHTLHDSMEQHWSRHVEEHLDKLAERLEIKASQEPAWQKFSAAFRETMRQHALLGHPPMWAAQSGRAPDAGPDDAAALAREQADRAQKHAQALAQLAEATAALQQSLGPEQRLVFNEAARHFAREHGAHPGMATAYHGAMDEHCERGEGAHAHAHWEHDEGAHSSAMTPGAATPAEPGDAAH